MEPENEARSDLGTTLERIAQLRLPTRGIRHLRMRSFCWPYHFWRPSYAPGMAQILPVSSTVEAVEVTSMWSWFAKNATYRRS